MARNRSRESGSDGPRGTTRTYWTRCVTWILLTGDRGLVALGIAAVVGVTFGALVALGPVPLLETQPLFYAYSGLIGGNLTLVTVVVSINQLLLSRELQTPDELRSQIDGIVDYRTEVEEATGEIAPVTPLGFLRLLVEATREEAQRLGGFARDGVVEAGGREIDDVVATVTGQMNRVDALIVGSETDIFSVLSLMLETNYAEQIHQLRAIRATHESAIGGVAHDSIDALVDRLRELDVARQYFKSIYIQQELSTLSRVLLYTGIPAVVVAVASLLVLTVQPGDPEAVPALRVVLLATLWVGLVPLAVLSAFFLRATTITKLTAATLPFTTPEQER